MADSPGRILVRSVNWLGDAVMTTPALLRLRQRFPDAHIALLTPEKLRDLWLQHPALDRVIAFPPGVGVTGIARQIRGDGFAAAVLLPNSPRTALEVWLAGIPRRIGYARPWRNLLLTEAIPSRPETSRMRKKSPQEIHHLTRAGAPVGATAARPGAKSHQIYEYLHLVAALGARLEPVPPALEITSEELEQVQSKWFPAARPGLLLGVNPCAAYGPAKIWPTERFAAVMRQVSTRIPEATWLAFGAASDRVLCEELTRRSGVAAMNLAGQTSLRELMGLLKRCRVLLTNDSGPMHVAAALNTPVVVPFGSTSPELTGPGLPGSTMHVLLRSEAVCSPCFRRVCPIDFRCMRDITVDQVAAAVLRVLEAPRPAPI